MARLLRVILALFVTIVGVHGRGFLIIGSTSQNKVFYSLLPTFDEAVKRSLLEDDGSMTSSTAFPLTLGSLQQPRSFATWSSGTEHYLYVYDAHTQNVYKYRLTVSGDALTAGSPTEVLNSVALSDFTVDPSQNIYWTTPADELVMLPADSPATASPKILYQTSPQLRSVKGLVNDGIFLYWANGASGGSAGSTVKAPTKEILVSSEFPQKLTSNVPSAVSLCVSQENVFYTSGNAVYVTRKNGSVGSATAATPPAPAYMLFNKGSMGSPVSCVYDAVSGALFFADSGGNAVYEAPGAFAGLRPINRPVKVAQVDGASALAVVRDVSSKAVHAASVGTALLLVVLGGLLLGGGTI